MLYALQIANCTIPRQPAPSANSQEEKDLADEIVDEVVLHPSLGVIAPRSEFEETEPPEESQQRPRFAQTLLENMRQHQARIVASNEIAQLKARLRQYEPEDPATPVELQPLPPLHLLMVLRFQGLIPLSLS